MPGHIIGDGTISTVVGITQAAYDALATPRDPTIEYHIIDEPSAGARTIQLSKPTHGSTSAGTSTLSSLSVPWTDTVDTIADALRVKYHVEVSAEADANTVCIAALTRNGTIIDRANIYTAGDGTREQRGSFEGIDEPGAAGTYTYEVLIASPSGTITMSATPNTNPALDLDAAGVSSMQLQAVT